MRQRRPAGYGGAVKLNRAAHRKEPTMLHTATTPQALTEALTEALAMRDEAEALALEAEDAGLTAEADAYWDEANALTQEALTIRHQLAALAA